jgi:hypothetical protein
MEMNDIYFGLVCVAAVIVFAVMLNYFMDFIEKDDKNE